MLTSPEVNLLGATTYGDPRLRAKIVHQVFKGGGCNGTLPIAPGGASTFNGHLERFWPGHEGKNLAPDISDSVMPDQDQSAEDFTTMIRLGPEEVQRLGVSSQPCSQLLFAELSNWIP